MDPRTDPYNVLTKQVAEAKTPAEREAAKRALELWCERESKRRQR
jgi:hypothetical protein